MLAKAAILILVAFLAVYLLRGSFARGGGAVQTGRRLTGKTPRMLLILCLVVLLGVLFKLMGKIAILVAVVIGILFFVSLRRK